jgi:hypothetical protein
VRAEYQRQKTKHRFIMTHQFTKVADSIAKELLYALDAIKKDIDKENDK